MSTLPAISTSLLHIVLRYEQLLRRRKLDDLISKALGINLLERIERIEEKDLEVPPRFAKQSFLVVTTRTESTFDADLMLCKTRIIEVAKTARDPTQRGCPQ